MHRSRVRGHAWPRRNHDNIAHYLKDNEIVSLDRKTEEVDAAGDLAVERGSYVQVVQSPPN